MYRSFLVPPERLIAELTPSYIFPIVRIIGEGFSTCGTGFALAKRGYIATAAHVVGKDDSNLGILLPVTMHMNDYQPMRDQLRRCARAYLVAHDPLHDLAVLKVDGSDVSSPLQIEGADSISVGAEVTTYGFPHADSGRTVLTRYKSDVGAKILLPSPVLDAKYLVLNSLARPGQSGSPVIRSDSGALVAVLCGAYVPPRSGGFFRVGGIDPAALHQTTHAVSAEYLRDMY